MHPVFNRVFVTVGTTKFEKLISSVDNFEFLDFLHNQYGTTSITFQIGSGSYEPSALHPKVTLSFFRLKASLFCDISKADLVISHCGAGTVLDTLRCRKPLVVVVNNSLMNNHQEELAGAMEKYCVVIYRLEEGSIAEALADTSVWSKLEIFPSPDDGMEKLRNYIYEELGLL